MIYGDMLARYGVKVITPPVGEQITLPEAKLHLRIDDDFSSPSSHPDDPLIESLIAAAREWCEFYAGRSLAPQTLELAADSFPRSGVVSCAPCLPSNYEYWALPLPMGPVVSVQTVTVSGTAYSDYVLTTYAEPARLLPLAGGSWPTLTPSADAIKVRYVAGYDLPGASPNPNPLPKSIRAAMLLVLAHLYENRENTTLGPTLQEIPMGAQALLEPYRLRLGMA
jgi:uncharacterized phiE125 gp8 family phage protein